MYIHPYINDKIYEKNHTEYIWEITATIHFWFYFTHQEFSSPMIMLQYKLTPTTIHTANAPVTCLFFAEGSLQFEEWLCIQPQTAQTPHSRNVSQNPRLQGCAETLQVGRHILRLQENNTVQNKRKMQTTKANQILALKMWKTFQTQLPVLSNETPTWCNTVQVLFLQGHSTCFGRKRPKHVEWPCRNKTCTVLHQVDVSFDLYYDARKHKI